MVPQYIVTLLALGASLLVVSPINLCFAPRAYHLILLNAL